MCSEHFTNSISPLQMKRKFFRVHLPKQVKTCLRIRFPFNFAFLNSENQDFFFDWYRSFTRKLNSSEYVKISAFIQTESLTLLPIDVRPSLLFFKNTAMNSCLNLHIFISPLFSWKASYTSTMVSFKLWKVFFCKNALFWKNRFQPITQ